MSGCDCRKTARPTPGDACKRLGRCDFGKDGTEQFCLRCMIPRQPHIPD